MFKKVLLRMVFILTFASCELHEPNKNEEIDDVSNIRIFYVDHYLSTVVGVAEALAYRIKESEDSNWDYLHDGIEGFEYEMGYVYSLKVNLTHVENPPADGSSIHYELVELLTKEAVDSGFSLTIKCDSLKWITNIDDNLSLLYNTPIITTEELKEELLLNLEDDTISKIYGSFQHTNEYRTIELIGIETEQDIIAY